MEQNKPAESADNNYIKLAQIDVGQHIEKKGQLSYLSWTWAVDQLMRQDPRNCSPHRYFGLGS